MPEAGAYSVRFVPPGVADHQGYWFPASSGLQSQMPRRIAADRTEVGVSRTPRMPPSPSTSGRPWPRMRWARFGQQMLRTLVTVGGEAELKDAPRQAYEEIKDLLGREMLDQRFAGMKEALEGATEEDRAAINEMLGDLNELLEKHPRGEDTDADFADFMDKHGDFFPEGPENIDELLDALAERAAPPPSG